jgi:hypothetical protein
MKFRGTWILIMITTFHSINLFSQVDSTLKTNINISPNKMKAVIFIINSEDNLEESKNYFQLFNKKFNYLRDIELKFYPDIRYEKYQEDLSTLKRGWSETAEIIDTRELTNYNHNPVRLILTDNFFELPTTKQDEAILHELGHYFTNPNLLEIRKYIAKKNPPIIKINQADLQILINKHNGATNFVFQIPKLIQEVNAELWVFEHERKYSESRIKGYCAGIEQFLNECKNATVDKDWFYNIPNLNFLILWRLSIFKSLDFDYIENCFQKTNEANKLFKELAATVNLDKLKIFTLQSDLLKSLEYKNENSKELIGLFEIIFDDFIINSARFFPSELQTQLVNFYKTNE